MFAHINAVGERLRLGLLGAVKDAGVAISISGPVTMPTLLFEEDKEGLRARTFSRAAAEAGAILHPVLNWNLSAAHMPADIDAAVSAAAAAFSADDDVLVGEDHG
ncbi:MAG: glutamate-1-semialdehyde 2,1-aminomutase [Candidatus Poriferisodalaceae bacterium]